MGVRRRYHRAEEKAVPERDPDPQSRQEEVGRRRHYERGQQGARQGQERHHELLVAQIVEPNVQSPREQEHTEHAVQEGLVEAYPVEDACERLHVHPADGVNRQERERQPERHRHERNRGWLPDPAMVRVGESGREREQRGQGFYGSQLVASGNRLIFGPSLLSVARRRIVQLQDHARADALAAPKRA